MAQRAAMCSRLTIQLPHGSCSVGSCRQRVASTGANVAVGGTDFNDLTNPLQFWAVGDNPITAASALSYVPESTWNDSCTNAVFINEFNGQFGSDAQTVCNNATVVSGGFDLPVGGSGGKSACTTSDGTNPSTCAGGNAKPRFPEWRYRGHHARYSGHLFVCRRRRNFGELLRCLRTRLSRAITVPLAI